ncbi:MAG TPA: hypothetical protein VGX27_06815 [Candidatus Dormibacteraeota bacterium]|nr:hypothetical protein [Candidatus Dormibacteraeota bacterium]
MRNTDPGELDSGLKARLRAELDRIRPPATPPRYLASGWSFRTWRLAPVALAVAITGILALSAVAATGSPNPVVWSQRVQTVINPPSPSPNYEESPAPAQSHTEEQAPAAHQESPEPTERPEPAESPGPAESPEPSGDHSNETATPSPGDH